MRRKFSNRYRKTFGSDRPIASLHELRRVHRQLRRWGRALPFEEFAGWRFGEEGRTRALQTVRRRRQTFLMGTVAAAAVLTFAVTTPLAEMPKLSLPSLSLASLDLGANFGSERAAGFVAPQRPAERPVQSINQQRPSMSFTIAEPVESGDVGAVSVDEPARQTEPSASDADHRPSATIASVQTALTDHLLRASIVVAGRIEAIQTDGLLLRVELALKGSAADYIHIMVTDDGSWLDVQPGGRLLAYLTPPDEADETAEPIRLLPAGRGALVSLSPMTGP